MSLITGRSAGRKWALGATGLLMLVLVAVWIIAGGKTSTTASGTPTVDGSRPTSMTTQKPSDPGPLTSQQQQDLAQSIKAMRAVAEVDPATSAQYPAVSGQARQQPDLYAAAFAAELLTQNYRTSGRDELLAWVQSESAQSTDPLVVGLTPAGLRGHMAVASVQDGVNGLAPVPSQSDWAKLAGRQGHTTVQILHVSEPVSWASAVANAQITDPGVTARQVDAEVTLQTTDQGRTTLQRFSVSLVVNLEGPPVRDGYGFVTAITYNVAAMGQQ
jgi:hypothetical protein